MFHIFLTCVCALLALPVASADAVAPSSKNPCRERTAEKDKGFVIGLAFWPGGTAADWGNSSAGLNPCSASSAELGDIEVAAYELKVDTIGLLQTSREIEEDLFARSSRPEVLSVVAFTGDVRSEARYIRSNDADATGGDGTGVLRNLVLIADFDEGKLRYLRWQDQGCFACPSDRCMQTGFVYDNKTTSACAAASIGECADPPTPGPPKNNFECFTSFQVGMSGTDKDSVVLNTGVQLQRIQALSLTNLYSDASTAVTDFVDSTIG